MPYFAVKDATGTTIYIAATGSGTTGDPYVPTHTWTNSLPAGTAVIGKVDQGTGGASAWKVDGSAVTQPVSVASLPLPTGAATSALQGTGNTSLASIDGKLPSLVSSRVPVDPSGVTSPVSLASLPALAAGTANIGDVDVASIAAGETHLGEVGGKMVQVTVELTRPANTTAYTANDVVSDSASASTLLDFANFARVNAGTGYITGARIVTDKKSITPRLRVHLYNASTPTVAADNAAWRDSYADDSKYIGWIDMPSMTTGADTTNSDTSKTLDFTMRLPFTCAAGTRSVFVLLETLDAFTPASAEKFKITLYGDLN